ncbi:MAG: hypothetical protein HY223_10210 [Thaumarchaeota archaeon]|nr:hypothetical protein [Nitrososphaerota archaeon]
MRRSLLVLIPIVVLFTSVGFLLGSINASAQQNSIPSWIKNTAKWWGDGQISDDEFLKAIQWLIDQKILVVHQVNNLAQTSQPTQENKTVPIVVSSVISQMLTPNDLDPFWKIVSVKKIQNETGYSVYPKIAWEQYLSKEGTTPMTTVKLDKYVYYSNNFASGGYNNIVSSFPAGGVQGNAIGGVSGIITWKPSDFMSVWEMCYGNVYHTAQEFQYSAVCVAGQTVVYGQITGNDVNMQNDLAYFMEKLQLK